MNAKPLPARPSLEQYKKRAKDLVKNHKSNDPEAVQLIKQYHPRLGKLSDSGILNARFALADAQLIIAREHGFESWPKFAKHIEALNRESFPDALWKSAEKAVISGDVVTLERLLRENPKFFREHQPPPYVSSGPGPNYAGEAGSIIARAHDFGNWTDFAEHTEALKRKNSPAAQFEAAVDAVITGDVAALERLLRKNPKLIRARSTRKHHATLLHYVGANGVEGFRQKTPKNAVKVVELLVKAGAEVDAVADMYGGGCKTLGLVMTSIHPVLAGVQIALMEVLLEQGATIDGPRAVNDCLANGRPAAAEFLARRNAALDLEGAAGVGRLDLVKSFFNKDGSLKANATKAQMTDGFGWACEYGRTPIVDFFLQRGMEVGARLRHHRQTGLHWAAYGGHPDTVKLLLERKAAVDVKDENFGGTPLEWALYGWGEASPEATRDGYYEVVELLVAAGGTQGQEWLADPDRGMPLVEMVRDDPRMLAALTGTGL